MRDNYLLDDIKEVERERIMFDTLSPIKIPNFVLTKTFKFKSSFKLRKQKK